MSDILPVLQHIELFHELSADQLERIAAISRREVYQQGDLIFNQNTPGDSLYVITQGQVEVGRMHDDGEFQPFLYLGQGQIFGEVALLDQGTRSATVLADIDGTVVHAISRDAFLALCRQDTALGFIVMKNLATDLAFKLRHRNADTTIGESE